MDLFPIIPGSRPKKGSKKYAKRMKQFFCLRLYPFLETDSTTALRSLYKSLVSNNFIQNTHEALSRAGGGSSGSSSGTLGHLKLFRCCLDQRCTRCCLLNNHSSHLWRCFRRKWCSSQGWHQEGEEPSDRHKEVSDQRDSTISDTLLEDIHYDKRKHQESEANEQPVRPICLVQLCDQSLASL